MKEPNSHSLSSLGSRRCLRKLEGLEIYSQYLARCASVLFSVKCSLLPGILARCGWDISKSPTITRSLIMEIRVTFHILCGRKISLTLHFQGKHLTRKRTDDPSPGSCRCGLLSAAGSRECTHQPPRIQGEKWDAHPCVPGGNLFHLLQG